MKRPNVKEKVNQEMSATIQKQNAVKVLESMNPKVVHKPVNDQSKRDGKED